MFERFDSGGRRVVVLAQEQARLLDHGYIGTEHLLLGVLALEGPLTEALAQRGAGLDAVRRLVEEIVGPMPGPPRGYIPFTPRAKEVLELSLREAMRLGHPSIGAAHVLLGLLREGQGIACQALVALRVDLRQLQGMAEAVASEPVDPDDSLPAAAALRVADVRAALRLVEERFGESMSLAELRVRGTDRVQVVVQRAEGEFEVVTVVDRGNGWEIEVGGH